MGSNIREKLKGKRWLAEALLYVFAAECVFGGSGRWLAAGALSVRIALFILCFFASLPFVLADWRRLLRRPFFILLAAFGAAVLLSAGLGLAGGNAPAFVWADVSGFLTLALLPGIYVLIDSRRKLARLLDVVFYASVFVGAATLALHLSLAFMDGAATNAVNDWINDRSLGGLAMLPTRLNRVYFRAQIFLQFSLVYGVWKMKDLPRRGQLLVCLCEGVMLFAAIASYTRGFWAGLAVSAAVLLVLEHRDWKRLTVAAGASLAVACVFFAGSILCYGKPYVLMEIVNRFDKSLTVSGLPGEDGPAHAPEATPTPPPEEEDIVAAANEAAVNLRADSLAALKEKIARRPLLGSGLGANLDGVREDGKTEYMYQDITMKMGVLGLLVFLSVYFLPPARFLLDWLKGKGRGGGRSGYLTAGYIGVAATSALNPFLTTPMGILMLALVLVSNQVDRQAEDK